MFRKEKKRKMKIIKKKGGGGLSLCTEIENFSWMKLRVSRNVLPG
jgi:hypothetical protein